jgi:hypothetical protein
LFSVVLWVVKVPVPSLPEPFQTAVAFLFISYNFFVVAVEDREVYSAFANASRKVHGFLVLCSLLKLTRFLWTVDR